MKTRSRFHQLIHAATHEEFLPILILLLVAGGTFLFVKIASDIREGETHLIDERIILAMRTPDQPDDALGSPLLDNIARDITALGSTTVLTLLTLGSAGFLVLANERASARLVVFAMLSGFAASQLLKFGYDRPRPDLAAEGMLVFTSSFPSGHAMHAALTYLTLGALLARVQHRNRVRYFLLALAMFIAMLVGISRIYLGVHWPTDVLAGWTAGATWALIWWLIAWWRVGWANSPNQATSAVH